MDTAPLRFISRDISWKKEADWLMEVFDWLLAIYCDLRTVNCKQISPIMLQKK